MEVSNRKITSKLQTHKLESYSPRPGRSPSPSKFASQNTAPEPFKPKARVNTSSVARTTTAKPSSVVSTSSRLNTNVRSPASSALSPRNERPTATPLRTTVSTSGKPMLKGVHASLKPPGAQSVPATPILGHKGVSALSAAESASTGFDRLRPRTSSVSLQRSASISSLNSVKAPGSSRGDPSPPSSVVSGVAPSSHGGGFKIKAKVTGLAKNVESLSPGGAHESYHRARTPSMSSSGLSALSASLSPPPSSPPTFYPITTATPAANPHRFLTARINHSNQTHQHQYQPFISSSRADSSSRSAVGAPSYGTYGKFGGSGTPIARVSPKRGSVDIDPATIPLPPHSPPASAVSYSSRSSVSQHSSASRVVHDDHDSDSTNQSTSGVGRSTHSTTTGDELDSEERKFRAEAKTNRKIADLEITNRSLLAINSTLESTKSRQAKEIRDLRRKLRETRLVLPPQTYRAIKSSSQAEGEVDDEDDDDEDDDDEGDEDDSDENDADALPGKGKHRTKAEETYRRVRLMMANLMESGKTALETKPADFMEGVGKGGARVLSAEEQRSWRGESNEDDADEDDTRIQKASFPRMGSISPAQIAVPNSGDERDEVDSEDEVEALTLSESSLDPALNKPRRCPY